MEALASDTRVQSRSRLAIGLVFAAGVAFTLYLAAIVPDEVFYSGDAGLKALHVRQFSRGNLSVYLELATDPRIRQAWDSGLYPFTPPFVYPTERGQAVGFPFFFQFLSAPLYGLLGFRGLYVIPLVSVWLLWALFCRTLARMAVPAMASAVGLFALIFASHLTLYAATFWEHTLAILLSYFAVDYFFTRAIHPWTARAAALAGLACGSAFLVRSEAPLFALLLCALIVLARWRSPRPSDTWFLGGVLASTAVAMLVNYGVYGQPLGFHGRQMIQDSDFVTHHVTGLLDRATRLSGNLAVHVPFGAFVVLYALLEARRRRSFDWLGPYAILIPCLLFVVILPTVVTNTGGRQLGPRYFLYFCPLLALLAAHAMAELLRQRSRLEKPLLGLLAVGIALGFAKNSVVNASGLAEDYEGRVAPALAYVRGHAGRLVIVDDTVIAQELEAAIEPKSFLLARSPGDVARAVRLGHALGDDRTLMATFTLAAEPEVPPGVVAVARGAHGVFKFHELSAPAR